MIIYLFDNSNSLIFYGFLTGITILIGYYLYDSI